MRSDLYRLLTVPITCVHCGMKKRIGMTDGCEPPEYGYDRGVLIEFIEKNSKCCKKPLYYMNPAGRGIFAKRKPPKKARSVTLADGTIEIYDAKGERTAVIV